mgnify:CR=1 FL=1
MCIHAALHQLLPLFAPTLFPSGKGTRPADCHSLRVRLQQMLHPKSGGENWPNFHQLYIYYIICCYVIEQKFSEIEFANTDHIQLQLPHLGLAGLEGGRVEGRV